MGARERSACNEHRHAGRWRRGGRRFPRRRRSLARGALVTVVLTQALAGLALLGGAGPARADADLSLSVATILTGGGIDYRYTVGNTSTQDMIFVSVADTLSTTETLSPIACPATTLAAGASMTCTAHYAFRSVDRITGYVAHRVTATGYFQPSVAATTTLEQTTPINQGTFFLELSPAQSYTAPGQQLTYAATVHNLSATDVTGVTVIGVDGPFSCPTTTVPAGQEMTCATRTYTTTAADVARRFVALGDVTATGADGTGAAVTSVLPSPVIGRWVGLHVTKQATPQSFTAPGQTVAYQYRVRGGTQSAVTGLVVHDSLIPSVDCPSTTIAPGAEVVCTASYTTTPADVSRGEVVNSATATGTDASGRALSTHDPGSATVFYGPVLVPLGLDTAGSPRVFYGAGQTITYRFTVTNPNTVPLTGVTVQDPLVSPVTCPSTSLAANASMTCTGTYVTTPADVAAGTVVTRATASGSAPTGVTVATPAPVSYSVVLRPAPPALSLSASASPTTFDAAGLPVTYSFTLANTGGETLYDVAVRDPGLASPVTCQDIALEPGATTTCTATYTTTPADLATGVLVRTATAYAYTAAGQRVMSNGATSAVNSPRTGPPGPAGPAGPQGPAGPSGGIVDVSLWWPLWRSLFSGLDL